MYIYIYIYIHKPKYIDETYEIIIRYKSTSWKIFFNGFCIFQDMTYFVVEKMFKVNTKFHLSRFLFTLHNVSLFSQLNGVFYTHKGLCLAVDKH